MAALPGVGAGWKPCPPTLGTAAAGSLQPVCGGLVASLALLGQGMGRAPPCWRAPDVQLLSLRRRLARALRRTGRGRRRGVNPAIPYDSPHLEENPCKSGAAVLPSARWAQPAVLVKGSPGPGQNDRGPLIRSGVTGEPPFCWAAGSPVLARRCRYVYKGLPFGSDVGRTRSFVWLLCRRSLDIRPPGERHGDQLDLQRRVACPFSRWP